MRHQCKRNGVNQRFPYIDSVNRIHRISSYRLHAKFQTPSRAFWFKAPSVEIVMAVRIIVKNSCDVISGRCSLIYNQYMEKKSQVIIPPNSLNPPERHEIEVAEILARHYKCVVEFLIPIDDYMRKTPDIVMNGILCEIKSPTGASKKHTVKYQFDRATAQHANCLVFDGRRTKLPDDFLLNAIKRELGYRRRIKRVIFITKSGSVIENSQGR